MGALRQSRRLVRVAIVAGFAAGVLQMVFGGLALWMVVALMLDGVAMRWTSVAYSSALFACPLTGLLATWALWRNKTWRLTAFVPAFFWYLLALLPFGLLWCGEDGLGWWDMRGLVSFFVRDSGSLPPNEIFGPSFPLLILLYLGALSGLAGAPPMVLLWWVAPKRTRARWLIRGTSVVCFITFAIQVLLGIFIEGAIEDLLKSGGKMRLIGFPYAAIFLLAPFTALFAGWGLWRLKPWALRASMAAIAWYLLGFGFAACVLVLPYATRDKILVSALFSDPDTVPQSTYFFGLIRVPWSTIFIEAWGYLSGLIGILSLVLLAWVALSATCRRLLTGESADSQPPSIAPNGSAI